MYECMSDVFVLFASLKGFELTGTPLNTSQNGSDEHTARKKVASKAMELGCVLVTFGSEVWTYVKRIPS